MLHTCTLKFDKMENLKKKICIFFKRNKANTKHPLAKRSLNDGNPSDRPVLSIKLSRLVLNLL